jgi:uncharacterized membrane protein (GlpM family)
MIVHARLVAIKGIRPHEWAVRFVFGGGVCVAAGLISKRFGPEIGGLFLAFPAIFPAGASLVEAHERKHKAFAGLDGTMRGRIVAGVDAAGAAIGCIGLGAFAVVCWLCLPRLATTSVFFLATAAWFVSAVLAWWVRKKHVIGSQRARRRRLHAFRR